MCLIPIITQVEKMNKEIILLLILSVLLIPSFEANAQTDDNFRDELERELYLDEIERIRQLDFIEIPRISNIARPLYTGNEYPRVIRMGAKNLARVLTNIFDGISIEKKHDWTEAKDGEIPSCEIENERYLIRRGGGPCLTTSAWTINANPNKYYGFAGIRDEIASVIEKSPDLSHTSCWSRETETVLKCYMQIEEYGINIFFNEEVPAQLQVIVAW